MSKNVFEFRKLPLIMWELKDKLFVLERLIAISISDLILLMKGNETACLSLM